MIRPKQAQYPQFYPNARVELSVVIPLFNETEVLGVLHQRLKNVITPLGIDYELLFVDDGSSDSTAEALLAISQGDPLVTVVLLTRHFGKEAALLAGLTHACGQAVIIMDGDLQDPPELIPGMLKAWRNGADVVRMRRLPQAKRSLVRRAGVQRLTCMRAAIGDAGVPQNSVDFMLYSRKAVAALDLVVDRKRYMKPMFEWVGFRETVIEYERLPRPAGSCQGSLAVSRRVLFGGGLLFLFGWIGQCISGTARPTKRPTYSIKKLVRSKISLSL
ncbi:glycosyltransferase family 2 protein [Alcaligenaceae bacterium]|nr:glycosyltransferase family 2 protein [Alcaligenaceae bacterium]